MGIVGYTLTRLTAVAIPPALQAVSGLAEQAVRLKEEKEEAKKAIKKHIAKLNRQEKDEAGMFAVMACGKAVRPSGAIQTVRALGGKGQ